jgi:hypothetical protein
VTVDREEAERDQAPRLVWVLTARHQQDPDTWALDPALVLIVEDWLDQVTFNRLVGVRAVHQLLAPEVLEAACPWDTPSSSTASKSAKTSTRRTTWTTTISCPARSSYRSLTAEVTDNF